MQAVYGRLRPAEHFLCRGERREFERGSDDGDADGVEEVGWLAWRLCHYLLALDRMPPRRRCGCGAEPLIYLGVLWPGIDEWTSVHFCRACLTRQRQDDAMEVEIGGRSGGPELKLEWLRSPVTGWPGYGRRTAGGGGSNATTPSGARPGTASGPRPGARSARPGICGCCGASTSAGAPRA